MEDAPSPKLQRKDGIPAQPEAVAEAEKITVKGIVPFEGEAVAAQRTVHGAVTVTVPVLVQTRPLDVAVIVQV